MIKLPLKRPKNIERASAVWTYCAPFVVNKRALLVHRPREVTTYKIHSAAHMVIHSWCGSGFTGGSSKFVFLADPPEDRLLCERCEMSAKIAGLPSADSLAGRHVHTGKLKAFQTCCIKEDWDD